MLQPEAPKFLADVHLGRLAHYLRMLGFDTFYDNSYSFSDQLRQAREEQRILLSRNPRLKELAGDLPCCRVFSEAPAVQLKQLLNDVNLRPWIQPFSRCMACNEGLSSIADKNEVKDLVPGRTFIYYNEFWKCTGCGRIYWKGAHYQRMQLLMKEMNCS